MSLILDSEIKTSPRSSFGVALMSVGFAISVGATIISVATRSNTISPLVTLCMVMILIGGMILMMFPANGSV